jgi:hypothetical protein
MLHRDFNHPNQSSKKRRETVFFSISGSSAGDPQSPLNDVNNVLQMLCPAVKGLPTNAVASVCPQLLNNCTSLGLLG